MLCMINKGIQTKVMTSFVAIEKIMYFVDVTNTEKKRISIFSITLKSSPCSLALSAAAAVLNMLSLARSVNMCFSSIRLIWQQIALVLHFGFSTP